MQRPLSPVGGKPGPRALLRTPPLSLLCLRLHTELRDLSATGVRSKPRPYTTIALYCGPMLRSAVYPKLSSVNHPREQVELAIDE